MIWQTLRAARRACIPLGLVAAAALGLGIAAPANAAKARETITASFEPTVGILTISGDKLSNSIIVSRDSAGTILVNGGAVRIKGGVPTVANTAQIQAYGQGGDDTISLNEASGALPMASLFGGAGSDTLIGGAGNDQLSGEADNDTLQGRAGADIITGGDGNDTITGGDGDDQIVGEGGNDRMVWNPGDDTDRNEGGSEIDTVEVNGGNGTESFSATANSGRVRFDRLEPAPFSLDIGTSENLVLNANGGDDRFTAAGDLAALLKITVDGGAGSDTLLGGNGSDTLLGGDGGDLIDGGQGGDTVQLGAGDDTFQWDPGDGSDTVEGQDGSDITQFNGANISENIDIAASGGRIRLARNVGAIVLDANGIERVDLNALGGSDILSVNDLTGTGLVQVNANLAGLLSGTSGDTQPDTVIVSGTSGANTIEVQGAGTSAAVTGLPAQVTITNSDGASDTLAVNGLAGNDSLTAISLPAGIVKLTADGGAGDDTLLGSRGADTLLGGEGNDTITGSQGDDLALLGAGDDTFQWNPGDGNDTVEGQDGSDALLFNGANIGENIDISASSGRVRFFRNVSSVALDLSGTERVSFMARGGADTIQVGDLAGTDLRQVALDLAAMPGSSAGDGQPDSVIVNGAAGNDTLMVSGSALTGVSITGVSASVTIAGPEGASDSLTVNGQSGDDLADASTLEAGAIQLSINGGLGIDTITGSQGNDIVSGGDGNDVALMGAGDDTFVWNPGDDNDTAEGQAGLDRLLFNGANISESFGISANGGRVRFSRDIAGVTLDLDDIERVDCNALGGTDTITVSDLAGTDLAQVNLNLAAASGGDGQADSVIVNGTSDDDVAQVVGDAAGAVVLGLAAQVNITGAEAANDRLFISALSGDDVVYAAELAAGAIQLVADGGDGADVLIGGAGNDTLLGGAGDDVLQGGPGLDLLDGGPGDNIVIQD